MRRSVCCAAALAALAVAPVSWAQSSVYKWTDSQGKVHFSDQPPTEPAKDVSRQRVGGGTVEVSQLPYATQLAAKNNPVTLFTAPQCGDPCVRGRTLLSDRGIPYTERDAQANPKDAQTLRQLIGALQVPVLVLGKESVKGWDESAWHAALDSAGYPRTKLPGSLSPKPVVAPPPPAPPPEPAEPAPAQDAAAPPGK